MEDIIKTFKIKGTEKTVEIFPSDTDSPRSWDNLGKMICFHGRYDLGDEHDFNSKDYNSWDEMKTAIVKKEKTAVILPLFLYDHSGLTLSTGDFSCPWDSGQVGWAFINKKTMKENGYSKKKAIQIIQMEVKEYDYYLKGDFYDVVIEQYNKQKEQVDYDICGGYFGIECAEQGLKEDI